MELLLITEKKSLFFALLWETKHNIIPTDLYYSTTMSLFRCSHLGSLPITHMIMDEGRIQKEKA